jgi:adenine-specific DNA-methyltransferase
MFPEVVTEGKVDFEKLKQVLGEYVDDSNERYNFTWNGKGRALRLSQTPSLGTLRPCKEESKNWDTTQNLYIEGDNLEVLKLLQKSYYGKIKMIYIDPPYNTGKDFVYRDDFHDSLENYKRITGQVDGNGKAISTNTETSGRYHTDWLNMMYPRLRLARNLLKDDGVIFISIDDNEAHNLRKICDEVFGEDNFVAQVIWERAYAPVNLKKHFSECHDYILCYAKNIDLLNCNGLPRDEKVDSRYRNPDNDPRGVWQSDNLTVGPAIPEKVYEIVTPNGRKIMPPSGRCWLYTKDKLMEMIADNRIWFGEDGGNVPRVKRFLSEVKQGLTPMTIWKYTEVGHSQDAAQKLKALFDGKDYFDYPKSIDLIKRCLQLYTERGSLVLDFFSGSATTAHAVMQLNAEDGGNRKFIMVQLPEPTEENSEAYKAGYKNICEIGIERIRRAGEKIKEEYKDKENIENLDIGFKVFKLDTSNIRKWQPDYDNLEQSLMDYVDNFVEGRTEFDVVYEIMLKYGLDLTYPVDEFTIAQKKVYSIGFGMLMICLDDEITTEVAKGILAKIKELSPESSRVVFKDNGFKSDSNKTNIKEILKSGGIEEFITI